MTDGIGVLLCSIGLLTSQVSAANVLFVDNPVGVGYSYVTSPSAFTTNVDEIAVDLFTLMTAFFESHTEFQVRK